MPPIMMQSGQSSQVALHYNFTSFRKYSVMIYLKLTQHTSNAMGQFWFQSVTLWVTSVPIQLLVCECATDAIPQNTCHSFTMLGSSCLLDIYHHKDNIRPFLLLYTVVTCFIQHMLQESQHNCCCTCSGLL